MLLLPLYFQQARHDTALVAGLLMVPQGVGSLLPRTLAGKLTDKIGPRLVVLLLTGRVRAPAEGAETTAGSRQ
jgi:MFS family permease